MSITTIGHAEPGRLWQSRDFWERADKTLDAHGLLLRHHDDYRAAAVPAMVEAEAERSPAADPAPVPGVVTCVTITWATARQPPFTRPPRPACATWRYQRFMGRPETVRHVRERPWHVG